MPPIDKETFMRYVRETKIIREYQRMLYTFGDMKLPYIFAGRHHLGDRVVVMKGVLLVKRPTIIIPGHSGPEFEEGFEHEIPDDVISIVRTTGLPYSRIHNEPIRKQEMEYGNLEKVLGNYNKKLKAENDIITGLIKGLVEGADVSLMHYLLWLSFKSAPGNIQQYVEHLIRQKSGLIRPDEKISEEDIRRLLG